MLIFIDDSGDAGFKLDKGSTLFFVIVCVIFDDDLEALKVKVAIKECRRKLRFPDTVEFKFFKSSDEVRKVFLQIVNPFRFRVRAIVIDKSKIRSDELKNNKNSFYSYVIKMVLQHSNDTILNAKIRIDGSGDRAFKKSFLTYLRKQLNSRQKIVMKNCKLIDSKSDELIQVADMIAGSIRRSYDKSKTETTNYKKIIKKHIEDEWQFK
ncbi:MAG TPA: DUF3800 domain-containing protein [Candidatus Saccharimonadales bacterium]|nr:DUF3800 domain-containing protein [Candidatus Saccharimonadales bacterium]